MSTISNNNTIYVPVEEFAIGQRAIKIVKDGKGTIFPVGGAMFVNQRTPVVEHIYYHDDFGSVCYLDENNSITSVGWDGSAPTRIDLWVKSLDDSVFGDIVLQYGNNQIRIKASSYVQKTIWYIENRVPAGEIVIERLCTHEDDTLDGTAIVTDWSVY